MSEETETRKEIIKRFLDKDGDILLFCLIGLTIIIRAYYFFKVGAQPIWWDEGDYLAIAKIWATGMETPEWWSHFTGMRPLLLPIIWAGMFKIGLGEMSLRFFTLLLPSIGSIYVTYLLGTSLFNKRIGLISSLMFSFYWVFLFYSYRLLTDIPAVFFGLLSLYFFWDRYIKQEKPYGLYLCFLFGVIAFSIRFPFALVPISCVVYLLFIKKHKLFTDKIFWKGVVWGLVFSLPYFTYFIFNKFAALRFYFGEGAVSVKQAFGWHLIPFLFSLIEPFWAVAFIIGIASLYPLIIYFDIIWKQKTKEYNPHLFLVIGLIIHLIFYIIILRDATDRWLLMLIPYIFIISTYGLEWVYNIIKKHSLIIAIIFVALILIGGVYQNLSHGNSLIVGKMETYKEVKLAGLWLNENSEKTDRIITASIVQNQYYSERQSYDYHTNDSIWSSCNDLYGKTNSNETCQKFTEEAFERKINEIKPSHLIVSVFEPTFTPDWVYTYPQRKNLTAVQGYADSQGNPLLIIYKF